MADSTLADGAAPGDADGGIAQSLSSAWASVKKFFADIPARMPCIPCMFKKSIVGSNWTKAVNDVFPGQQSYQNCGLQSTRQIVDEAKGKLGQTELQYMDDAIASCGALQDANHPDDSGGTSAASRQCVMAQHGVPSPPVPATVANVDDALRNGKGVIMSSDADVL